MRLRYVLPCALLLGLGNLAMAGSYAPAAGQVGSTAIGKDDPGIVAWATDYQNYLAGTDVDATWQTPGKALGPPGDTYDIVSLGNGGQITMTFAQPITDGAGADFAVFENAFSDTYLELAFVEVSSDGVNFFRFPTPSPPAPPVARLAVAVGRGGKRRHARDIRGRARRERPPSSIASPDSAKQSPSVSRGGGHGTAMGTGRACSSGMGPACEGG